MRQRTFVSLATAVLLAAGPHSFGADDLDVVTHDVGKVSGFAMRPGSSTVLLALADNAAVVAFDLVAGKEVARKELGFKPEHLALQGDALFATARGSGEIHVLDAASLEPKRTVSARGVTWQALACHPTKGPIFASSAEDDSVWVLNPDGAELARTTAHGSQLAVDPKDGAFLYTATMRPGDEVVEVNRSGTTTTYKLVTIPQRTSVRRYAVAPSGLKLVGANPNAAVGRTGAFHVSPDGAWCAAVGGGGWRPERDEARTEYVIAVLDASDLPSMKGRIEVRAYPKNVAFHPELSLGAATREVHGQLELMVFTAGSLEVTRRMKVRGVKGDEPGFLAFAAKGTRLVHCGDGKLSVASLPLAADERKALEKAHGELPPGPAPAPPAKPDGPAPGGAPVRVEPPCRHVLEPARVGAAILEGAAKPVTITELPAELEGALVLVRNRSSVYSWFHPPHDAVMIARPTTAYVAILVERNGVEQVTDAEVEGVAKLGWKRLGGTLAIEAGRDKTRWALLSRAAPKGAFEPERPSFGRRTEFYFFFK